MNTNVSNVISRFTKSKVVLILVITIVILILTNPTKKDFDQFIPVQKMKLEGERKWCDNFTTAREYNFIILSLYRADNECYGDNEYQYVVYNYKYIGILKNFFECKSQTSTYNSEIPHIMYD